MFSLRGRKVERVISLFVLPTISSSELGKTDMAVHGKIRIVKLNRGPWPWMWYETTSNEDRFARVGALKERKVK